MIQYSGGLIIIIVTPMQQCKIGNFNAKENAVSFSVIRGKNQTS